MTQAITTHGLSRQFPGGFGVHDLNLNVPQGSIYGFLGPNGAGKTTTIRLLLDLLLPDAGTVALFGQSLSRNHRDPLAWVGGLVDSPSLYGHLTGWENLEVTRRLLAVPKSRIDEALKRVDLTDAAHRRVRDYSLGMRQRLAIALALLGEPRLLILDEPGNGLDPAGTVDMRVLLRNLADDGVTVLVSSHLLSEMEQIATHVGVLRAGQLCFEGPMPELRARIQACLVIRCDASEHAKALLIAAGETVTDQSGSLIIAQGARTDAQINQLLVQAGIGVEHLAREHASLESLFFDLTVGQKPFVLEKAA